MAALAMLLMGTPAAAADAKFCADYAADAVEQAALAERLACAFRGFRWMTDAEAHRDWCLHAPRTVVEDEAAARSQDVRLCLCEWYAAKATAQARQAAAEQCAGLGGPRWSSDKSAHYRWCVLSKPPLTELESEVATRKDLLAACKP